MREDGLRLDRLLLVTDTNYIPTGSGPTASSLQLITHTVPAQQNSHVIHYTYDDLYRLTNATYSGNIAADYAYTYDPVGNMMAYTETIGSETTQVTRTFDDANRLQTSFDFDQGITSYLYDNNGNLSLVIPPGGESWLHYAYDQRNLMISHTTSISGTSPQPQASYSYDGSSNRTQQVAYTGVTPITTTYTNDIVGLSQVLVADDGLAEVYNLWGLRLLAQDDGQTLRVPLTDGLGTVRVEMVGDGVESVTTYDPYGNLLIRTGDSSTAYGFTGEQHDEATGLLYLRARYYNPALRSFMGKDAWNGSGARPQSMNGWSYVNSNPTNLIDPSGMVPALPGPMFPSYCTTASAKWEYVYCVAKSFGIESDWGKLLVYKVAEEAGLNAPSFGQEFDNAMDRIKGTSGCYWGPIPYRAAGYSEGLGFTSPLINAFSFGDEVVYDFGKMERGEFRYSGTRLSDSLVGSLGVSESAVNIEGFSSWKDIASDYEGISQVLTYGAGPNLFLDIGFSKGKIHSLSLNLHIKGDGSYIGLPLSFGVDPFPIVEFDWSVLDYSLVPNTRKTYIQNDGRVDIGLLANDIEQGDRSPGEYNNVILSWITGNWKASNRNAAFSQAFRYAWIYENMEFASGPIFP
jgi:RHS repeat-associated protein